MYYFAGEYQKAINALSEGIDGSCSDPLIFLCLAKALVYENQRQEAIVFLESRFEDITDYDVLEFLGELYKQEEEYEKMLEVLSKVVDKMV